MSKTFIKLLAILIFTISNYAFSAASDGTYDFFGWTSSGNNLTHTHFTVSGGGQNDGGASNMQMAGSVAYGSNPPDPIDDLCFYKVAVDGINTGSFELSGISANEFNSDSGVSNVSLVGNTTAGGVVTSDNTIAGTPDVRDNFNTADLGLSNFNGVQLTSFELKFSQASGCHNVDLNSFSIINAQDPGPSNATPIEILIGGSSATLTINENVAANTSLGALTATDDDPAASHTFTLTGGDTGLFAINSGNLEINHSPDYETTQTYTLEINVNDTENNYTQTFHININNLNDNTPTITSSPTTTIQANNTYTYTLAATDVDNDTISWSAPTLPSWATLTNQISFAEQTGSDNPFDGVDVGITSTPAFVDIDNDGDMDAFIGENHGDVYYYKNTGSNSAPTFTEQTSGDNPFNGVDVGDNSAPTFVDIDNDGDMDAFIGENNGTINYYKNTGNNNAPIFSEQTGGDNPFNGVNIGGVNSAPTFVDIDNDGDRDAFIGGFEGNINYYENTGSSSTLTFTERTGGDNPFNGVNAGIAAVPTFVDIDNDGDRDAFIGGFEGNINYYENTGSSSTPTFSEQTGSDNPFGGVTKIGQGYSAPTFVDIDNDGDKDAFIGDQAGNIYYYKNTSSTSITGIPSCSDMGNHTIEIVANDGNGGTDTQTYTITVIDDGTCNAAPTLTGEQSNQAVNDNTTITPFSGITLADTEGDNVSITLSLDDNAKGTLSATTIASGTLSSVQATLQAIIFTPTENRVAVGNVETTTITIQISDANGSNTYSATTVVSTSINDAPSITTTAGTSATEDIAYSYDANASDADTGDTQEWSISNIPTGMTLNTTTGVVSWTPLEGVSTSGLVLLTVTDAGGLTATQDFTISVTAVNDAPVITGGDTATYTVAENQTAVADIASTDVDNADDQFSTTLSGTDAGSFTITTAGVLTFNTAPDFETKTTYTVIVTASDGSLTDTQTITVNITNVNDNTPTFTSSPVTTADEGSVYSYNLTATDSDASDVVSFSVNIKPSWLTLTGSNLTGTPTCSDVGANNVELVASDGTNNTTQSFSITVTDSDSSCNAAPTFTNSPTLTVNEDSSYSYTPSATDAESDAFSYSLVTAPSFITMANTTTGVISGTPENDNVGTHAITIRVADAASGTNQNFVLTVNNTNDNPTGINLSSSVIAENNTTPTTIATLSTADVDSGDSHSYTLVSGNGDTDNSNFSISGSTLNINTVTDYETQATYTVRVQTTDSAGSTFATALVITVANQTLDSDSDGISDDLEHLMGTSDTNSGYYGSSITAQNDLDNDGLPDSLESYISTTYNISKINATTDSDNDGLPDALEVVKGYNPKDSNSPATNGSDDDNNNIIINAVEYYLTNLTPTAVATPTTYNDLDLDGLPDALEIAIGSNPADVNHPTANGSNATHTTTLAVVKYLEGKGVTDVSQYKDSDYNLVPDIVEIAIGSNPFGLSVDNDNDGIADATELYLSTNGGSATLSTTLSNDIDGDLLPDYLDFALPLGTQFNTNANVAGSNTATLYDWMVAYGAVNYPLITPVNNNGLGDSDGDTLSDKEELATGFNPFISDKPYATLVVKQDNIEQALFAVNDTITFDIKYQNAKYYTDNSITYQWKIDDSVQSGAASRTFATIFSTTGTFKVKATITKDNIAYPYIKYIKVGTSADGDADGDGIADSIDTIDASIGLNPNDVNTSTASVIKVMEVVQDSSNNEQVRSNPAMIVRAGVHAITHNKPSADISDLIGKVDTATGSVIVPNIGTGEIVDEVFDFEVTNIPLGVSEVKVVIPLKSVTPLGAKYYKLTTSDTWQEYSNIETASSVNNDCYDNAVSWSSGVNAGKDCIRLTLEDGDPTFDLDGGVQNGEIKDPGALVIPNDGSVVYGSGSGGGCTLSTSTDTAQSKFDPMLYILLALSLGVLFRKHFIKVVAIATLLIGANSQALEDGARYYVGIGIGHSSLNPTLSTDYTSTQDNSAKQMVLGVHLPKAKKIIPVGRLSAELSVVDLGEVELTNLANEKSSITYKIYTLGATYFPIENDTIRPFLGSGYRYISQSNNDIKPGRV
jgi:hypothetical protein